MYKKNLTYDNLWIKDLTTCKLESLMHALQFFFEVDPYGLSKSQVIQKIEEEKAKKEKIFSLVIYIEEDNQKIKIPFPFARDNNGQKEVEYETYLAEIDFLTTKFESKEEFLWAVATSDKLIDEKYQNIIKDYLQNQNSSAIAIKVVMNLNQQTSKYDDFLNVVYSDNEYLTDFLNNAIKRQGLKPIYASSQTLEYSIGNLFETNLIRNSEFRAFCLEKLEPNIWPYNKTFQSGSIKDLCINCSAVNPILIFRKYKNIRIASTLLSEFDYQKRLKRRNIL